MKNKIEKQEDNDFLVFISSGGHGKQIMATAVIEAIKKEYPNRKIIVVTAWSAPFYGNPHIFKFFTFEEMNNYFYDDFIRDRDTIIFQHDPYHTSDYINKKKHLIEIWCDLFNIPYNGEKPKIYLNPREIEIARDKLKPDTGKPIMMIQPNGGLINSQYSKKSWARDIPSQQMQAIINYYSKSYRIIHIKLPEQPIYNNVEALTLPHRELYAAITFSKKRLFIDSFGQHTSGALGLPSTVCWIVNKPEMFGYNIHDNIFPNAKMKDEMNKHAFIEQYNITGGIQEFPFEDTVNIFDINQIMESLKKQ